MWAWLLVSFGVGVLLTAAAEWTLRRRFVRRLRSAQQRALAAERLAEIGSMTGGLAHEIKNPLSTIGLNAQLLAEGVEELPVPAEEKSRLVRRVQSLSREVERLRGILTDFLEYAGELRLDPKPTDLNQLITELVDFFLPQAQKQGVRVRFEPLGKELISPVDAPHIKQALLNLMLNAVQAMAGQTEAENLRPRELILRTEAGTDAERRNIARIHVIDTGPGVSPEIMPRLFSPYFTTKVGGSGLGLATTRRLIEAHHGRIDVYTKAGQGTDFCISLPRLLAGGE